MSSLLQSDLQGRADRLRSAPTAVTGLLRLEVARRRAGRVEIRFGLDSLKHRNFILSYSAESRMETNLQVDQHLTVHGLQGP